MGFVSATTDIDGRNACGTCSWFLPRGHVGRSPSAVDGCWRAGGVGAGCSGASAWRARRQSPPACSLTRSFVERIALAHLMIYPSLFDENFIESRLVSLQNPFEDRPKIALGILSSQYTWYLPQSYIYFCAGRRGVRGGGRLLLVGCAHAALVAPALAVLLLASTSNDVHYTLVQGVLISSVGSGCGWLSLALSSDAAAAPLTATSYFVSLLTTPLAMILLCGRAVLPAPSTIALTCLPALGAWMVGAAWTAGTGPMSGGRGEWAARVCALVLLYMECCEGLALRGSVRLGDLMAVLLLEASWLGMGAGACWGYARCGLLPADDARTLALCALPKGAHVGWHSSLSCISAALARLPAICLAPAQALLLAAIAPPTTPSDQPRVELK